MASALDGLAGACPGTAWEAKARAEKGLLLKFQGDWDGAIVEFQRALELPAPQRLHHDVRTSLACIALTRGLFDEARTHLELVDRETTSPEQKKYVYGWLKELRRQQKARRQTTLNSCGSKSLAYLLRRQGDRRTEEQIAAAFAPHDKAVRLKLGTVLEAASRLGMKATAVRLGVDQLGAVTLPLVALVRPEHYVVVLGREQGRIEVYDPDRGRERFTPEALARLWTGYALVFGEAPPVGLQLAEADDLWRLEGGICNCCPPGGIGDQPGQETEPPDGGQCQQAGMPYLDWNAVTFNLRIQDVDLRYQPLRGPQVEFRRWYNNDSPVETELGPGWTHSYNWYVQEFPGEAQLTRGSGRIDRYQDVGGGDYAPPSGVNDQLRKLDAATFELEVWSERLTYRFSVDDTRYRLQAITDRNGNAVTLGYTDNTPVVIGGPYGGVPAPGYLESPRGVGTDSTEYHYVVDSGNHRLQVFDAAGASLSAVGGFGSAAGEFNAPNDVAVDPANGVLYVADTGNNRIQKFTLQASGVAPAQVTNWGADLLSGPKGVAVDESGIVYVADTGHHRIVKYAPDGTWLASWGDVFVLQYPEGLAVSGGLVYVANTGSNRITVFDTAGAYVRWWGGFGTSPGQFSLPTGVAVDPAGIVHVADKGNNRVQSFTTTGGFVAAWGEAGSGSGQFSGPEKVAFDGVASPARLVVADTGNDRCQRFDTSGQFIDSFGRGGFQPGVFQNPLEIALGPDGGWFVNDSENDRIQRFDAAGSALGSFGEGRLVTPRGVAFDAVSSRLFVADASGAQIRVFDAAGNYVTSFGVGSNPFGIAAAREGSDLYLYVVCLGLGRVQKYQIVDDATRSLALEWAAAGNRVAIGPTGDVFVGGGTNWVRRFSPAGDLQEEKLLVPHNGLHWGSDGHLYLTRSDLYRVERYDAGWNLLASWGAAGDEAGEFYQPAGLALDGQGNLLVADQGNDRIQKFAAGLPLGKSLAAISDAVGQATTLGYDSVRCKINRVTDPLGRSALFGYTGRELTSGTDMENVTSTFEYDPGNGFLLKVTVPAGEYRVDYNDLVHLRYYTPRPADLLPEEPDPYYELSDAGLTSRDIIDPLGNAKRFWHRTTGETSEVTDGLQNRKYYFYDEHGNRNRILDEELHEVRWSVDGRGRTTGRTDAGGRTTTRVYDDVNHRETVTGPPPHLYQTVYQRDANDNLLTVTDARGKTTTMTWYADGRLHTVTTPMNKTTVYAYDDVLRTTTIIDPLQHATVLTYDELGRLTSRRDATGRLTVYEYDALGRRRLERHQDGTTRETHYDCCQASVEQDEFGRQFVYEHDEMGRVTTVANWPNPVDPESKVNLATYHYDLAGRREWMKDVSQRQTTYTPDAAGRTTDIQYPDATHEGFTYFDDGRVETRTDRLGRVAAFVYWPDGQLRTKTYSDGSSVEFTYDADGRLESAVTKAPGGAVQTSLAYTYVGTGQVESVTAVSFGQTKVFRYGYRDDGLLEWWRDESVSPFKTTSYAYYDDGRLQQIADPEGKIFLFEYYADGSLKKKTYGNGTWAEYEYDPGRGWLTALRHRKSTQTSGIMASFVHKDAQGNPWYDAVGNRLEADVTGSEHHTYDYDETRLDRLLGVDRPQTANDEAYTYDEMGNRARPYSTWTYDTLNDQLDTWVSLSYTASYTYDLNGNRSTKTDATGTTIYGYDGENRLVLADPPGAAPATYDYDALGRRVRKVVNGTATLYWYSEEDIVVETGASGSSVQARYTHGPGIDSPLKVLRGSSTYYYHEDPLGSIVLMTNASKISSKSYKYDAFGNVYSQTGTVTNFYQYTGREWDAESALYYYRARHYDPKIGRFLQQDPIPPRPEEMNAYVYTANNPVNLIDPTGEVCGSWWNDWAVTDAPGMFDFTACCQTHDNCYSGTCGFASSSKTQCDDGFYNCMIKYCNSVRGGQDCYMWAANYHKAVKRWGGGSYKKR